MTALRRLMALLGADPIGVVVGLAKDAISAGRAVFKGTVVSDERIRRRVEICAECPWVMHKKYQDESLPYACGQCGCAIKSTNSLLNLAAYEETSDYGCKHPDGSRWAKEGV